MGVIAILNSNNRGGNLKKERREFLLDEKGLEEVTVFIDRKRSFKKERYKPEGDLGRGRKKGPTCDNKSYNQGEGRGGDLCELI